MLFLLRYLIFTNKILSTFFGIYLIYLTRDAFLKYDIIINNIKSNYIYFIFLAFIFGAILLIFYKNLPFYKYILIYFYKNKEASQKNLTEFLKTLFSIIINTFINITLNSFYNKPNHLGISQHLNIFSNDITIKKCLSYEEKIQYLNEILPLINNISKKQINELIISINWDLINCKNDLYVYIISYIFSVQEVLTIKIKEESFLYKFKPISDFVWDHPYITSGALLIIIGGAIYYRDSLFYYLKKTLDLFNEFLKEHRLKVIADMKIAENQEILGNQIQFLTQTITKLGARSDLTERALKAIQDSLVNMQNELVQLSDIGLKDKGALLIEIAKQKEDIAKILRYITSLMDENDIS